MVRSPRLIIGIAIAIFLVPQAVSQAALLYFDPEVATVSRGDTVTLALRLDTDEDECVNAVDATIHYDPAIRAVDVSRGESILSVWLEEPTIDEEAHTITFVGGIPGGYCGRISGDPSLSNILAELVFRSPGLSIGVGDVPLALVTIGEESQVLLNDGLGSAAPLRLQNATIELSKTPGNAVDDLWRDRVANDTVPPSDFSITLTRDDNAFSGNYFIVFNSLDKQSGIDHYEVIEESLEEFNLFTWGGADAPWVKTSSPYVLKDQTLNSTIRVRAIDKAGNETVAVLIPEDGLRSMTLQRTLLIGSLVLVVLLVVGLGAYALWRRKQEVEKEYDSTIN